MPKPTSRDERQLLRLLLGELPAAAARDLERRLAADAALRARYERLAATWEALEPPPVTPLPDGFRDGVTAAARRLAGGELSWSRAPAWARGGAAVALAAGLVLGVGFGRVTGPRTELLTIDAELDASLAAELAAAPPTLAEAYWLELDEDGEPGEPAP